MIGVTPTPVDRTGYYSQVSTGPEKNSFKAIHSLNTHQILRPILTVNKWL